VPSHTYGAHAGLPALPEATAAHVPLPHVAQGLEQGVLQHTPPAQLPLWHWSAAVHVVPLSCVPVQSASTQLPLVHSSPVVHAEPGACLGTQPPSVAQ
jgi:hypothetical protein